MSLVENLKVNKGRFSLEVSHFEILDEGIHVIMGPSGSGKSTFLRVLLGLESGATYSWKFGDLDLSTLSTKEKRLGVVFQNGDLFPHMTAYENVVFAAEARGLSAAETDELWVQFRQRLKMQTFADTKAESLSGGERQRTALARALIGKPRFLLLDEPFSSLDEDLREETRELVRDMIRYLKVPTLLVTHDLKEAQSLADRMTRFEEIAKTRRA